MTPKNHASLVERRRRLLGRLANLGALAGAALALLYALDSMGVDIGPLSTPHAYGPSLIGCVVLSLFLLLRALLVPPGARFYAVSGALLLLLFSPAWLSAIIMIGESLLY